MSFDVKNKQHRRWYYEFVKNNTWGRCPVRFIIADDHGDLLTMIRTKLNEYYVQKEFGQQECREFGHLDR